MISHHLLTSCLGKLLWWNTEQKGGNWPPRLPPRYSPWGLRLPSAKGLLCLVIRHVSLMTSCLGWVYRATGSELRIHFPVEWVNKALTLSACTPSPWPHLRRCPAVDAMPLHPLTHLSPPPDLEGNGSHLQGVTIAGRQGTHTQQDTQMFPLLECEHPSAFTVFFVFLGYVNTPNPSGS